jgi:hypothetical protein
MKNSDNDHSANATLPTTETYSASGIARERKSGQRQTPRAAGWRAAAIGASALGVPAGLEVEGQLLQTAASSDYDQS